MLIITGCINNDQRQGIGERAAHTIRGITTNNAHHIYEKYDLSAIFFASFATIKKLFPKIQMHTSSSYQTPPLCQI